MPMILSTSRGTAGLRVLAAFMLLAAGAGSSRAQDASKGAVAAADSLPAAAAAPDTSGVGSLALTAIEKEGWLQWLHSLEQSVAGRTATGQEEANLLYPLDRPAWDGTPAQPYRHLTIAKAVGDLEAQVAGREQDAVRSPLLALSHARNYLHLSEYDSALTWYAQTASVDAGGDFRREIGRETLAAAICARDSSAARRAIERTLAAADLEGREAELILALRWLLNHRDSTSLDALLGRMPSARDPRLVFWRAYALSWLGRRGECLAELRTLLPVGGLSRGLNERERSWVLTAVPDLLLLQGEPREAGGLYERLAASSLPELKLWGGLQTAGLAFRDQRYATAGAGFRQICESDAKSVWGAHACAMADIADQLNRLYSEGERYGAAAHYRR